MSKRGLRTGAERRSTPGTGRDAAAQPPAAGQVAQALAPLPWTPGEGARLRPLGLSELEHAVRRLVEPYFDASYYLLTNQDVSAAAIDPLDHYVRNGRWEERKPAHWFDPAFYRDANPDAAASGQDPFLHYITTGRAEGCRTFRVNTPARQSLAQVTPPSACRPGGLVDTILHLHPLVLVEDLRVRLVGARGLTLSVSHDQYTQGIGDIQNLVGSEQAGFNARGEAYLHLAPAIPLMTLAFDEPGKLYVHITVNGAYLGATTAAELLDALATLSPDLPQCRRLVVHCLFGHSVPALVALHEALARPGCQPPEAVFWIHDYHTVCVGYALLRNDTAFCGAPPPDSLACRVCIYGQERPAHVAAVRALFDAIPFRIAAPSSAALALWLRHAGLPHRSAEVVDVLRLDPTAVRLRMDGAPERGSPGRPVCIAFVGDPAPHKGWNAFRQIASELSKGGFYRLVHLSSSGDQDLDGVTHIPVRVSPGHPNAMTAALTAAGADLVLVLSNWPETFCIAASEALAAGADVLTLECSGNVADLVQRTGRGRVFATADGIAAFLASPEGVRYVRARHSIGAEVGRLQFLGATATMPPDVPPAFPAPAGQGNGHGTALDGRHGTAPGIASSIAPGIPRDTAHGSVHDVAPDSAGHRRPADQP